MAKSKDLTSKSEVPGAEGGQPTNNLNVDVGHVHIYTSDLKELTKLAEVDPYLAEKVVDQRERQSIREESSYKFSLIATLCLLVVLILGVVFVVVYAGVLALAFLIFILLATALLIRVIITGEWSETTWVGSFVKFALNALGGKQPEKGSEE